MNAPSLAEVGAELPELTEPEITRALLTQFADASGDRNPVHLDQDAARAAGLDDVIAHGMLSMAFLGKLLTTWVSVADLLSFRVSFPAPTPVHATLRCTAKVRAVEDDDEGRRARLAVTVRVVGGPLTVRGEAVVRVR